MKNLLMVSILLVSTISFANGIERYSDDNNQANQYSWSSIFKNHHQLEVDKNSVINPAGASLFNVCVYDQNHFKVVNPGSKCVEYDTREVRTHKNGGQTKIEKNCVKREKISFQLVSSTYNKCVETTSQIMNPEDNRKDQIETSVCVKTEVTSIPTIQKADVYSLGRGQSYQFSKTYEVPNCDKLDGDLPDTDIPDGK